jgi:hypothetical protein
MADSNKSETQTEQIRLRAYEIYLERGGTDEDWILAERELTSRPETKRVTSEKATDRVTERAGRDTGLDAAKTSFSSVVSKRT